jgi:disulfide bond formation protein DsbB
MSESSGATRAELVALAVALVAAGGSIYLSVGMGLRACPLCFYQRTFVMAVVGVLAIGLIVRNSLKPGVLGVLCLPAALGGLGVAGWHVFLEAGGKMECPAGIAGVGTAPQQSLAIHVLLAGTLLWGIFKQAEIGRMVPTVVGAAVGAGFAYAAVISSPPPPAPVAASALQRPVTICTPIKAE